MNVGQEWRSPQREWGRHDVLGAVEIHDWLDDCTRAIVYDHAGNRYWLPAEEIYCVSGPHEE